ncbi:MAG: hypothetical protein HY677_05215 [Chloroflexi bacterium]|nr:hypothetical protein [Chloroflexota bacterium]
MAEESKERSRCCTSLSCEDAEALAYLQQAIASGTHWYLALLDAIGLWTSAEETHEEVRYRYLIAHEAFDWLLLAERLCGAVNGAIPEKEKEDLLIYGRPPIEVGENEFKRRIGSVKYRAYLNYLYGIVLEEALHIAVEEEVRKELHSRTLAYNKRVDDEVYTRIYGATFQAMRERYLRETGAPANPETVELNDLREFTYWLFKYRLLQCDKAKVASDTKKALAWLERQQRARRLPAREGEEEAKEVIELSSFFVRRQPAGNAFAGPAEARLVRS